MLLSPERFEHAVALLHERAGEREGRRVPRVPIRGTVNAVLAPGDPAARALPVNLRDVSRGGVGFTHHGAIPKGTEVLVDLPATGGGSEWVRCVVRHCEMLKTDLFFVGVEFVEPAALGGAGHASAGA